MLPLYELTVDVEHSVVLGPLDISPKRQALHVWPVLAGPRVCRALSLWLTWRRFATNEGKDL